MGIIKKFRAGYSFEAIQLLREDQTSGSITTIPFVDTAGVTISTLIWSFSSSCSNYTKYATDNFNLRNLEPRATADVYDENNFNVNDNTAISVCSTNFNVQRNIHENDCSLVYTINITNNDTVEQTVSCIKFVKKFLSSFRTSDCTPTFSYALCYGYYLDRPVEIPVGESRTVTVEIKITVGM